ncbi:hypothetical protein SpCBS45565_g03632 [Spizellomyces sp. 'palustris']|nr:hypothetical protein SpCBS45565_g03632 [Spizellomyces sp. 'palustris']
MPGLQYQIATWAKFMSFMEVLFWQAGVTRASSPGKIMIEHLIYGNMTTSYLPRKFAEHVSSKNPLDRNIALYVKHALRRVTTTVLGSIIASATSITDVLQIFRAEMDKRHIHDLWVMDRITQERSRITFKQKWLYMIHHEMMLAALGIFAALGGIVVLAFIGYQLSLVFRGVTTNESFKWDDLDYDIRKGQLRMPRELYDFNHGRREEDRSTTPTKGNTTATRRKGRKVNEKSHDRERDDYVSVKSIAQIRNIYHGGPWANLMDILFPSPLNM